jgi:hypothetical protein
VTRHQDLRFSRGHRHRAGTKMLLPETPSDPNRVAVRSFDGLNICAKLVENISENV